MEIVKKCVGFGKAWQSSSKLYNSGVTYGFLHVLPTDKYKAHIGRGDFPEGDHGRPGERLAQREPAVEHREDRVQRLHPPPQHQLHGGQRLRPASLQSQEGAPAMSQIVHKVSSVRD